KTRLRHIFTRWGYAPEETPKREATWPSAQKALSLARKHGDGKPAHLVEEAIETVLAHMQAAIERDPDPKSKPGNGHPYFMERFKPRVAKLVKTSHEARVEAELVETKAKIEVKRAEDLAAVDVKDRGVAKDKGQAALDRRIVPPFTTEPAKS